MLEKGPRRGLAGGPSFHLQDFSSFASVLIALRVSIPQEARATIQGRMSGRQMADPRENPDHSSRWEMRVGIGTDRHRLEQGRPLILCGIEIPSPHGPVAHSDGDVILHAVSDALLGACACEDIGSLFPDTDPRWKDVESSRILSEVLVTVSERGWKPSNVDVVVHLERPKLVEYRDQIRQQLAEWLGIDIDSVGLKAKTGEGIGPVGESRVIDSMAVVQLVSREAR